MNVELWKRIYLLFPDDPKVGLRLRDEYMEQIQSRLKLNAPDGVELREFTDGGMSFAGFIAHVDGGPEWKIETWLRGTMQHFEKVCATRMKKEA